MIMWAAFEDATDYGHVDQKGGKANEFFCNRRNLTDISWWWFRVPILKQTYTDYELESKTLESSTEVTNGGEISNVQKFVQYRNK